MLFAYCRWARNDHRFTRKKLERTIVLTLEMSCLSGHPRRWHGGVPKIRNTKGVCRNDANRQQFPDNKLHQAVVAYRQHLHAVLTFLLTICLSQW
jgi:hypothetical protein